MAESSTSSVYPVLPLRVNALFPSQIMPISVNRLRSTSAIESTLKSEDKTLLIVMQRSGETEDPGFSDLYEVGTLAVIKRMQRSGNTVQVIVQGGARAHITQALSSEPHLQAAVALLPEPGDTSTEVEALFAEVVRLSTRAIELLQPEAQMALSELSESMTKPIRFLYVLGSIFSMGAEQEQAMLEASTQLAALRIMHEFLSHQVGVLELRHQIASQAQTEMSKQQREYFLRQQLEAIQKELGDGDPGEAEAAELRRRVEEADLPDRVRQDVEKEVKRLERMSPAAADYQVSRTYIDLVLDIPWKKSTKDILDLRHARNVLDEDHFDLEDVKDRILEHLAVMKLNPEAKAPILCFVGPPGVGKTSLGQSIARAMGRKFERMSLGGLHDEAELRGHRRTYVGAMPGRIIQAIRRAGVHNPLLMLDEVDKLGRDFRGDPASALMEILDPAQNFEFRDNYLDLPFDLSGVFFITTANALEPIPRPLLDRMEVLRLPGYSEEDKLQIARRYLIPRQLSQAGLSEERLVITEDAINEIVRRYTREAGVRELERMLGRIARKTAARFAEQSMVTSQAEASLESCAQHTSQPTPDGEHPASSIQHPVSSGVEDDPARAHRTSSIQHPASSIETITVTASDLADLLGAERFFLEKARRGLRPGVATGLAWTEAGGEVLYVETVLLPQGRGVTMTGQLGRVMKESARAARSYIRSQADRLGFDVNMIRESGVHIHVPAGAVPKDGPSAGVAIVTALASLYSGFPIHNHTAMTGEITLSGLVLPVGGIREKVLAARRAELHRVILPHDNESDLRELPKHVRHDFEFVLVEHIEEALKAAIPELATRLAEIEPQLI